MGADPAHLAQPDQDLATSSDTPLRLTPPEATELIADIAALLARYRRHLADSVLESARHVAGDEACLLGAGRRCAGSLDAW